MVLKLEPLYFLNECMMKASKAREALNNLNRKLLLLKCERHKAIRNKMIDDILDNEDGEVPCIAKFIKESKK